MCDCIGKIDALLEHTSARLATLPRTMHDGSEVRVCQVVTVVWEGKELKERYVDAEFCPFCGEKYGTRPQITRVSVKVRNEGLRGKAYWLHYTVAGDIGDPFVWADEKIAVLNSRRKNAVPKIIRLDVVVLSPKQDRPGDEYPPPRFYNRE